MRATTMLAALTMSAALLLGGCGSDGSSDSVTRIEVTFAHGDVTPQGDRLDAKAGEPIAFVITADEPGEIHVHSSPEQEFEYESGTHTYEVTIDTPGLVEVESHDLEKVIVQLEVS